MDEELNLDHFDLGTFVDYVHALKQERDSLRAQLPSQGGEAVEVVAYLCNGGKRVLLAADKKEAVWNAGHPLMEVAQHLRIMAAATHPVDQVAEGVVVSRELLEQYMHESFPGEDNRELWGSLAAKLRALLAKSEGVKP